MEKTFPNGFTSWQETHFEIVAAITRRQDMAFTNDFPDRSGIVEKTEDEEGQGGLYELAEMLTDKFEVKHGDFEDGEFFDLLEEFLDAELNS